VVTPGTGADLKMGQALQIRYVGVSGADGSTTGNNYATTKPDIIVLGESGNLAVINDLLVDQKVGVRILVGIVDTTNKATTVVSTDVTSAHTILTRAIGTAVAAVAGLPSVTLAADGSPSITLQIARKPSGLVVQDLITGAGPVVVKTGDTITIHFSAWLWDRGIEFDSSWNKGSTSTFSTTVGSGEVIKGLEDGLIGKTVGSEVLLIVPAELGYGAEQQGPVPGGSTLVFVIDILNVG
jgi:peptidylprolyl isomerase